MKIENKEMLLYSMNKAYDELEKVIRNPNSEEKEVYFRLGSCLHWIMDCYDRVKEIVPEEEKLFFLSLAAVNNAQKHVNEFERMNVSIGSGHPRRYPRNYGIKYVWKSLEDVPLNSRKEKRLYQENMVGKNIIATLSKAKEQIQIYFERE